MKNQYWKIITIILGVVCLGMAWYILSDKKKNLATNEVTMDDVNIDELKKSPIQAQTGTPDIKPMLDLPTTSIIFEKTEYNFDTIRKGEKITRELTYRNAGNHPYILQDIRVSCGCTIPSYDKKPIKSGEQGIIQIEFDSKDKEGFVMNKLSVFGNTKGYETPIFFKVYVKK